MRWVWRHLAVAALALALAAPAMAQERAQTLADIRQELSALSAELLRLQAELSPSGSAGAQPSGSVLDRLDAVDSELRRLTAKTEELEFRIDRIVADGTNRIGDLEFRLRELEGGDLAQLPVQPPLGGTAPPPAPASDPPASAQDAPLLAVGEQADFDAARALLDAGDYTEAEARLAAFIDTYAGGPLMPEAHFLRGRALDAMGSTPQAARAYLEAFNAAPDGNRAAEALMRLGTALGTLGQREEACLMLQEVGARFPASAMAERAQEAGREFNCP